ncbi:hypothetical protein AOQ84DRAFT_228606, partial [Glonium stellatum]
MRTPLHPPRLPLPLPLHRPHPPLHHHHHRRTFLPNPFSPPAPQVLTARRTLPYPSPAIYAIIADVPRYSSFLPYCQSSTVTRWSGPDRR